MIDREKKDPHSDAIILQLMGCPIDVTCALSYESLLHMNYLLCESQMML